MSKAMRLISQSILSILSILLFGSAVAAQELGGLAPPIRQVIMLVDTRSEDPPVYSGVATAPALAQGQTLDVQVFVPEAAGKMVFGYFLHFDDTDNVFADNFTILAAKAWATVPVLNASGQTVDFKLAQSDMPTLKDSSNPGRSITFANPPAVPSNGVVATFTLKARRDVPRDQFLRFTVSVCVYSTTPPSRLWNMVAQQTVGWR
jgi:hypothetical protein